jgi:hypothetical protein
MKLKKWTLLLLVTLLSNLASPILSRAATNTELCFKEPEAKKLLLEIEYGQVTAQKFLVVQKQYSTCTTINKNNDILITGLKQDKIDLTKVSDEFKKKFIETNQELNKVKDDQPSRAVWFGLGAGATIIVGILLAFLVRK